MELRHWQQTHESDARMDRLADHSQVEDSEQSKHQR
jgi:hypothetical protein